MQRGVDNLHVVVSLDAFGIEHILVDFAHKSLVHLGTDGLNTGLAARPFHVVERLDFLHLVNDAGVVRRHQLAAVTPIGLVAVVFLRVVRRRQHHARLTFEIAHRETQFRSGTHIVEQIDREAIGSKHVGRDFGELATVVAAVVRNGGTQFLAWETALYIVGQALRGHTDGVAVHTVGAHAHNAAQAARAEFKAAVETLVQFFGVLSLHLADSGLCFFIVCSFEPSFYICQRCGVECRLCHNVCDYIICIKLII